MNRKPEPTTEAKPNSPAHPEAEPARQKPTAPRVKETEPVRCSSPPCMMGELDEILEE